MIIELRRFDLQNVSDQDVKIQFLARLIVLTSFYFFLLFSFDSNLWGVWPLIFLSYLYCSPF